MALRVCVLGSGSSGNCIYVASEQTGILIDAGLSCKETEGRLATIGVELSSINALCITHEHGDHVSCLGVLHRKIGMPLYANAGTIEALERNPKYQGLPWNVFTTGTSFEIEDIKADAFSVPHDSYDPVGFVLSKENFKLGIAPDMGMATELIRERLKNCQAVVIESNHDEHLLNSSLRPWSLKQRIAGRQGHLSNTKSRELLLEIVGPDLKNVFLAHLSSDCNDPELAIYGAEQALKGINREDIKVHLTYASKPSSLVDL